MLVESDVEQEYGIHILNQVTVRDGVYQLFTQNHGILCLKRYRVPESEIRFIAQVITHLAESGFMYGPKMLLTTSQRPWITRNEVHYMLINWTEGHSPDFENSALFKKALRLLAKFHSVAQGLPAKDVPEARLRYHWLHERFTSYQNILGEHSKMGRLISICNKAKEHLSHPKVVKAIEQEQTARSFVHGDFNYPNLVLNGASSMHMIDFENTSLHVRMQDFSHILHRNFPWQGKETLHWIDYYNRKRPLSEEDLRLLYALLLVPYPVIRALQYKKKSHHAKVALPTTIQIKNYTNELKLLL
ncbi:Ser/Thr protein kinase RdoA involved in Cpx stress response, MazF antagonist [Paenibacillus sp. yr247]|uniref:phosphotransferase n=1 Tax=Paenibacillus sp. yr247 TaxID=1761880 RepID=UPI00087E16AF|nr:phosphotransferase [Paenibacillus sp. yr247]SDN58749.1 Ser/Thr protein kinase RdoA involved in Cpx stress response, MazF antagonist [Paenibacillus sp. yr247]